MQKFLGGTIGGGVVPSRHHELGSASFLGSRHACLWVCFVFGGANSRSVVASFFLFFVVLVVNDRAQHDNQPKNVTASNGVRHFGRLLFWEFVVVG